MICFDIMDRRLCLPVLCLLCAFQQTVYAQRTETLLESGWKFHRGEAGNAQEAVYDDSSWEDVCIPHDWAIYGPFDVNNDLQTVRVTQDYETKASVRTGRTGGLPYMGVGWYRRTFDVPEGKRAVLLFDGAMSEAKVYVNGEEVCFWPYGYSPFHCDVTSALNPDGNDNVLAVRLENRPQSSRWYPGAGLYRNVHLITVDPVHVPVWGTRVTTPHVDSTYASVRIETLVENPDGVTVEAVTEIAGPDGRVVASSRSKAYPGKDLPVVQNFIVENPSLWSPETPFLYEARTVIYAEGKPVDSYNTAFGIRSIEFVPYKGFFLNGQRRKFQGVCNHHDLGPLGAAVNVSALRHQLMLLKDMGCDAVRTSHNMPAPELVRLCDEMGFMMMIEPFDEWDVAKCTNGYHRFFDEWAERDMVNMLHCWRNNPCVVMWSIGNEVPTQCSPDGYKVAEFLQDICHREDPTRPVTCGMDQVSCVLDNGFAALVDIPGLNYRTFRYKEAYEALPQGFILGSETASAVSSRGEYMLPAERRFSHLYDSHQCSSYDLEACSWSNIPDVDFALADDYDWTLGQFVWTGFDYLGEPAPYDKDSWPNHSSMFGIIDLASIPKDRYYLYRSIWNRSEATLHVLPHWNWEGHEGENVPVFVYTSWPEAELFINGVSFGRQRKQPGSNSAGAQDEALEGRYRLMWHDAVYQPGEVKVVAYDESGAAADSVFVRTAGRPHHIELETVYTSLKADGKDLAYVTASIVDRDGNLCPSDASLLRFEVEGAGSFRAVANGDPTCLEPFHLPQMHVFNGRLTVILQSGTVPGDVHLTVRGKGLRSASLSFPVVQD